MLYYTIHQSSIWSDLPDGKRNVRILVISLFIYIILHAIVYELRNDFLIAKLIHGYFFYILFVDFFASAILYKTYYGRTVLQELNPYENDKYDEVEHKYHQYNPMEGVVAQQHEESIEEQDEEPIVEQDEELLVEQDVEQDEEPIVEQDVEQDEEPIIIQDEGFRQFEQLTGQSGLQMSIFQMNK